MKCFPESKQHYINFLSIFYAILSAVLLLFGFIALQDSGNILAISGLGAPSLAIAVTGILLLILSLIGFYTGYLISKNTDKSIDKASRLSLGFVTMSVMLMATVFSAGVSLLRYRRFLVEVRDNSFESIGEKLLMYQMAVFEECCIPFADVPQSCEDNGGIFPCIPSLSVYEDFLSFVGDTTCRYFSEAGVTSDTDPNSCGGQTIIGFIPEISAFLYAQMSILGIVNILFCFLLGILTCLFSRATYYIPIVINDNEDRNDDGLKINVDPAKDANGGLQEEDDTF